MKEIPKRIPRRKKISNMTDEELEDYLVGIYLKAGLTQEQIIEELNKL